MTDKKRKNYPKGTKKEMEKLKKQFMPTFKKRKKHPKRTEAETDELKKQFLELYEKDGVSINSATKELDFNRTVTYKWAETDPKFAIEFERIKLLKTADGKKVWENRHGKDEENKKLFLEIYADPATSVDQILKGMGKHVNTHSLKYWKKTDLDFREEYEKLQEISRPRHAKGLKRRKDTHRKGVEKRQKYFLEVFRNSLFNITKACQVLEIPRTTWQTWMKTDADFKTEFDAIEEERKDFIEYAAMKKIESGDTIMTIFAAKCVAGWQEKPRDDKLTVEIKHDKVLIDAVVKAAELSQGKYFELPNKQKQITEQIIDAEYEDVEK